MDERECCIILQGFNLTASVHVESCSRCRRNHHRSYPQATWTHPLAAHIQLRWSDCVSRSVSCLHTAHAEYGLSCRYGILCAGNLLISFQFTSLAGFFTGWLEIVCLVANGLVNKPSDLGLANGFLGSVRQTAGVIAGKSRHTIGSGLYLYQQ